MAGVRITIANYSFRLPAIDVLAAATLAILAGLLGGASRNARIPFMIIEFASLPAAALAVRGMVSTERVRPGLWPLILIAGIVAIPLIQSIPLPPRLWLGAPGQEARFAAVILSGLDLGWAPLSLDPAATLAAMPALVPPIAMFLITLTLGRSQRQAVAACWIAVAVSGLFLGMIQLVQIDGGWAYPYTETSRGYLVGWFSNRNHEAAMLLALTPIAAALAIGRGSGRWIAGAFLLVVLVALGAGRSRAAIFLAAPVVVLSAVVLLRKRGMARRRGVWIAFGAITLISVLAVATLALTPILARFGADAGPEFRYRVWPVIWREALPHLPFGSGAGTFDRVFRAIEPLRFVVPAYFNHAHNDYLEVWLEAGWMGAAAMGGLIVWTTLAAWRAWSTRSSSLARAASVGIAVLAAVSWVDYPLRTESLAVLFAFLLAAMTPTSGRHGG